MKKHSSRLLPRKRTARKLRTDRVAARADRKLLFRSYLSNYEQQAIIKDYDGMLQSLDLALGLYPNAWDALAKRAIVLLCLGRDLEALESIDRAMTFAGLAKVQKFRKLLGPIRAEILCNLRLFQDALSECDRSPELHRIALCRARSLAGLGRFKESLASFSEEIGRNPDNAIAHVLSSFSLLSLGQYAEGWSEYEWRIRAGEHGINFRYLSLPRWTGKESVHGKTLLLVAEQGLGDTIQFIRYAPLLAERGAKVIAAVQPPLVDLISGMDGIAAAVSNLEPEPDSDFHCPVMSLPFAFGTTLETIPSEPYLTADASKVQDWQRRISGLAGKRIGLVWSGNPRPHDSDANAVDRRRSITLEHFSALAVVPGVNFISLQKGPATLQTKAPPPGMVIHDWTDELNDFTDTAALIGSLDLVISVDTAPVHLAAALGKPVWLLNRFDSCWRWMTDREDSPWYPTLRIFRQSKPGDWAGVIDRVVSSLQGELAKAA